MVWINPLIAVSLKTRLPEGYCKCMCSLCTVFLMPMGWRLHWWLGPAITACSYIQSIEMLAHIFPVLREMTLWNQWFTWHLVCVCVCVQDRMEKVGPLRCCIQKTYCSTKANLKEEKCWVALPTPTQTNICIRSLPSTQNTKQSTLFSIIIRSIWEYSRKG